MIVQHIIDDLKSIFEKLPEAQTYGVAFANYLEDGSGQIHLRDVEACHWDDDDEFFLIPEGAAKHYELQNKNYTGQSFLKELMDVEENISDFVAYARARIKIAKDGSVASLNSPLWGIGYHEQAKLVYFYHGSQPG